MPFTPRRTMLLALAFVVAGPPWCQSAPYFDINYNYNKQEQTPAQLAALDGGWDGTYEVNGQQITLGQIQNILQQNRPTYGGEIVCANEEGSCCPAYCCNVKNTLHDLEQKPMDQSFRKNETSSLNGTFQVLSKQELFTHGTFAATLYKDFPTPIFGGWTLELNFNKAVFDLHSFNAKVVGMADGDKTYFLRPVFWNKNVPAGPRRLIVQGLTTPEKDDGLALEATGALWYDPTEQAVNMKPLPYVTEARPVVAPPAVVGEKYNLAEVLQLSILFYEAQRSGKLPADKRILWRGDSGLNDKTDDGKDLSGGWYDAGDHVKLQVPMAYSATILLWGLIRYPDAYVASGEMENMQNAVRWGLDYFVKAHTAKKELYVQVSDEVDHCYWGRPENMTYHRRAYKVTCQNPGSQPVMNTASALAAGSIAFKESDPKYAAKLLGHAKELFAFAEECPGDYIKDGRIPAGNMYNDGGQYLDEHAFAAAWLHKATGEKIYLNKAVEYYWQCCSVHQNVDQPYKLLRWADMSLGVNLLLYESTHWDQFASALQLHLDNWMATVPRTPKGLSYFNDWAANRFAANAAFTAIVAADLGLNPEGYRAYAKSQIMYMLGDCCLDPITGQSTQSHLIGFGPAWPVSPHHRGSSCKGEECSCTAGANVRTLWGALIGGPTKDDMLSADGCSDFVHSEVALDFSAGFTSAVAGLKHLNLVGGIGGGGGGGGGGQQKVDKVIEVGGG